MLGLMRDVRACNNTAERDSGDPAQASMRATLAVGVQVRRQSAGAIWCSLASFTAGGWRLAAPTKVPAHNAMPGRAMLGVELLLDVGRHVLFYRELVQRLRRRTGNGS